MPRSKDMGNKTYDLTETELLKIARLCQQEQGSLPGIRAEASLMANLLETTPAYSRVYGSDIYSFARNSRWFSRAAHWMDSGSATPAAVAAVRDVLVFGHRFFPGNFVNEHDCFRDIKEARNDGKLIIKNDRSAYVRDKTVIKNVYGSVYTFYAFPDGYTDPFGYTDSTRRWEFERTQTAEKSADYILVEVSE